MTITIPDGLAAVLAERGISDEATLNRFAIAALTAYVNGNAPLQENDLAPLSANDIAALDQAIDDVRSGRTRPAAEFFDEFRTKYGIRAAE